MSKKLYPQLSRSEVDKVLSSAPHKFSDTEIQIFYAFISDKKEMTEIAKDYKITGLKGYRIIRAVWDFIEKHSSHSLDSIYRPIIIKLVSAENPSECTVVPVPSRDLSQVVLTIRRILASS